MIVRAQKSNFHLGLFLSASTPGLEILMHEKGA